MREKWLFILVIFATTVLLTGPASSAIESQKARAFVGQDLHLAGRELISYQPSTGEHILVFQGGFSMSIGANEFFSDSAVVWLESLRKQGEFHGRVRIEYKGRVYLQGNVSVKKGRAAKTVDLEIFDFQFPTSTSDENMVVRFGVSGEVFVTADERKIADPRGLELYARAVGAVVSSEPELQLKLGAPVPELPAAKIRPEKPAEVAAEPQEAKPRFQYPVHWAPVSEVAPKVEWDEATKIGTVIGRLYVWQKLDERGGLLELQADNAVMFLADSGQRIADSKELYAERYMLNAIYMSGDVVMTEGQRTVRGDEIYYDFEKRKGLAVNAVMRSFDVSRGIPIYVRAAKLRQVAENQFAAEDITLTSSEFYQPQISLTASTVFITDTTTIDAQAGQVSDSSYDAQMRDVRLKVDDKTIFYWPFIRSNLQRPDIPLKGVHTGYDETWGGTLETRWYLARLLGLTEPAGTDSTFELDYYSKRGLGSGVEIDYEKEDYFGRLLGYVIHDTGKDDLGRHSSRRDLEPACTLRGRFHLQHRHFLPHNWQLTTETSYASDEHFIESFYRNEFNVGKEQETIIHLKRVEDNWALSLLGKGRINDFAERKEELPGAEFHWTGQSLFDDKFTPLEIFPGAILTGFTLYSDTEVSRLRQRIGENHSIVIDKKRFSFASHRTELDMPIKIAYGGQRIADRNSVERRADSVYATRYIKVVPFVAGTFGYDDRSGFRRSLVDGSGTGSFGEDKVWIGEAGVRVGTQYWKVYPNVKSRLWDLDQLRHIIKPRLTAVLYEESDSVIKQHDTLNAGISHRLQTKRGPADEKQTVDWMRLDMDFTWVSDSEGANTSGPDRFIWSKPIVPMGVLSAPDIFHGGLTDTSLHRFERFGPRRNYLGADYIWRLSDTGAVLSDMYFDMQSAVVQQFNVGFSQLRWPNLSYYIGSRYLRRAEVLDEKGSNALTFALSYILDPRYTLAYSGQFDFDYGANIRSDVMLIRRYHRMSCSLTFSADESLERYAIIFSIWPQGVPELALGPRRYTGY